MRDGAGTELWSLPGLGWGRAHRILDPVYITQEELQKFLCSIWHEAPCGWSRGGKNHFKIFFLSSSPIVNGRFCPIVNPSHQLEGKPGRPGDEPRAAMQLGLISS